MPYCHDRNSIAPYHSFWWSDWAWPILGEVYLEQGPPFHSASDCKPLAANLLLSWYWRQQISHTDRESVALMWGMWAVVSTSWNSVWASIFNAKHNTRAPSLFLLCDTWGTAKHLQYTYPLDSGNGEAVEWLSLDCRVWVVCYYLQMVSATS